MKYGVREAILVKRNSGSIWHVTFAPLNGAEGDEIKVKGLARVRLEQMSFSAPTPWPISSAFGSRTMRRQPRDVNELAKSIVDEATGEAKPPDR